MNPGEKLNIKPDGNFFNVGIGRESGHVDISMDRIVAGYSLTPGFSTTTAGDVLFRTHMNGKTTSSNTKYPRSELRELDRAQRKAAWNAARGTHVMQYTCRVTHVPPNKSWVCFGQIHDAESDLIRVQTEGQAGALAVVARWTPPGTSKEKRQELFPYKLGDPLVVRFEVINGVGRLTVNGALVEFPANTAGCYFKVGAYAQTNTTYDDAADYVEVEVQAHTLRVWHSGYPGTPPEAPVSAPKTLMGADPVSVDPRPVAAPEIPAQSPPATLFGCLPEWLRRLFSAR